MMLNNKGQTLVIFVIFIPLFIGMMSLVFDIGNVIYEHSEVESINKIIIDYGLDNMDDNNVIEEMRELAVINKKNINTNIKFNDMEFLVESTYYVKGVFSNIFRTKGYLVKNRYKGYIDSNNKKRLVKLK